MIRRALLVPASLLAVAALAGPARAINCPSQTATVSELRPTDGATNVPVNAVIEFGTHPAYAPYEPSVSIQSNGGAAIPGALETGPAGVWIFRPNGTLAPNTTYTVSIMDQSTAGGAGASGNFTTGTALDLVDPGTPTNVVLTLPQYVEPVEQNGCSKPGYWDLHVAWQAATNGEPVLYGVDVSLIDLQPEFAGTPYKGVITSAQTADVGVPQNSEATAVVYAVDGAGRQAHSQPVTIIVPIPPQHHHRNACDVVSPTAPFEGGAFAVIGAATLALLVFRRRAR